jgi:hypothetical protein
MKTIIKTALLTASSEPENDTDETSASLEDVTLIKLLDTYSNSKFDLRCLKHLMTAGLLKY